MNIKKFLKLALGTGLVLLEQTDQRKKNVFENVSAHVNDFRDTLKTLSKLLRVAWAESQRLSATIKIAPFGPPFDLPLEWELAWDSVS